MKQIRNDQLLSSMSGIQNPDGHILHFFDAIQEGIYVIDKEWRYVYLNKFAAELIEQPREEVLGKNVWELFPEAVDLPFYQKSQYAIHEQQPVHFEAFYPPLNKWFESTIYPSKDGITVVSHDISALKKTQEAIARNEMRLKRLIDSNMIGIIFWDTEGNIREANDAFLEMLGYTQEDLHAGAVKWAELNPNEYDEADQRTLENLRQTGMIAEASEREFIHRNGSRIPVLIRGTFLDASQREGVSFVLDITRQKQAQAELQKQMQEFLTLAENIPDIVARLDRDFRYLYVNPAIEKVTGIPASAFPGKSYREVGLPEDQCILFDTHLKQVFTTGEPVTVTYSFNEREGERHYLSNLVPEQNTQGEIASVLVITRDVTVSKELELRKDNFISMASHELKTPITTLKGMTQLLKKRMIKQGIQEPIELLARMEVQIDRLTRLINELLDVSKIQAGQLDYREEPVDIDALVKETIETLQPAHPQHTLTLMGTSHATVRGDKDHLEQVLINLITNAIKYSPEADKVDISVAASSDAVQIDVRDYGAGIPKAAQEKIFDRFYRVQDEKNRGVLGLGMGLHIASEIVKRHKGKLTVASEEGKGSTFSVLLPR